MARVSGILDQARANVVRAVNSNMVIAYWLIGREIVQALQGGEERAEYGSKLLRELSVALTKRYGRAFRLPTCATSGSSSDLHGTLARDSSQAGFVMNWLRGILPRWSQTCRWRWMHSMHGEVSRRI